MKVSVISVCHRRFENFEKVLKAWLDQEEVNEVIVLDNSGNFKTELPVTVFSVNKNLGPQAKYPIALQAQNDCVIFADDDILVEDGIVSDFLEHWDRDKVVGVIGRIFDGDSYYTSTGYRGENVSEPTRVDWIGGGCTMTSRRNCIVLPKNCPDMCLDDIWWESHIRDRVEFYVIPTTKYQFLPENYDNGALHSKPEIKELREKYYKQWGFKK